VRFMLYGDLGKQAQRLLLLISLYSLAISLSSIFLSLYFFKGSDSFIPPILFYLGNYVGLVIGFLIAGYLVQKISINSVLSLGLVLMAIVFGTVVIVGNKGETQALFLGSFFGLAQGLVWLIRHLLEYQTTDDSDRNRFFAITYLLGTLTTVVAPIIAGFLIVAGEAQRFPGYAVVFSITGVLLLICALIARLLKHESHLTFDLGQLTKLTQFNKSWKRVEIGQILHGVVAGLSPALISLVTFLILKDELSVGGAAALGAMVALIAEYLIGSLAKPDNRLKIAWTGVILGILAYVVLSIGFNISSLGLYIILVSIATPMVTLLIDSGIVGSIDNDAREKERVIAYFISAEMWWNVGRVISIILGLVLIQTLGTTMGVRVALVLTVLVLPLVIYNFSRYNKNHAGASRS
jgi:MFS transporter, YQGE family, putative transporter